ncbi:MAG TPA: ATP-binding protein [Terriglobales bacterium]|nr:ATP-binding protein [Terriglobales bacterium]
MRSSSPSRLEKSLALRLTIWYGASFVMITVALSVISYIYLSSAVRDNRKIIQGKSREVAKAAQEHGVDAFSHYVKLDYPNYSRKAVFVRLIDANDRVSFQSHPEIWQEFRTVSRAPEMIGIWQYVPSTKDRDVLELMTTRLPGGYLLQAGKEIQDRKEILEHYRDTTIGVTCGTLFIGLLGGAFLSFRTMRPVRQLTQVIQSVVLTGNVNARVPRSGRGDELDDLSTLFNQMLDRIQGLISGMKDALDNVAHDLRTPLTRLRGTAEVALQGNADLDQCREALASNIEESDRIRALLTSLMDISEAETGTMRLKPEKINLADLLGEVAELYQYVAEEKNVSIKIDGSPNIEITADRNRMRQVFANLMDNAIKYNRAGGQVIVHARREPTRTIVAFEDSGIAIAPEDVDKIWGRLYRADKSRSQPGLGLGLSLVQAVVRAHHGTVEVKSTAGKGSLFTLSLPLSPLSSS